MLLSLYRTTSLNDILFLPPPCNCDREHLEQQCVHYRMFTALISTAIWAGTTAVPENRCTQWVLSSSSMWLAPFAKLNYISIKSHYLKKNHCGYSAEGGFWWAVHSNCDIFIFLQPWLFYPHHLTPITSDSVAAIWSIRSGPQATKIVRPSMVAVRQPKQNSKRLKRKSETRCDIQTWKRMRSTQLSP